MKLKILKDCIQIEFQADGYPSFPPNDKRIEFVYFYPFIIGYTHCFNCLATGLTFQLQLICLAEL